MRQNASQRLAEPTRTESETTVSATPLDISIIIPLYNEERSLPQLAEHLQPLRDRCEIVMVDGGSSDDTVNLVPSWCVLVKSPKGRGAQLNTGARESSGDVLLFLHCDSLLPENPLEQITSVMKTHDMGFFGIEFDSGGMLMRACARQSNRRARKGIPFGDQGIFIKRETFFQLGGFPDQPIMEDFQFSLTAKEHRVSLGQTPQPIVTSSRRFGRGFVHQLTVILKMQRLRKNYLNGTDPNELVRQYRDIR